MREFKTADGQSWQATALVATVAHRKEGRVLAFVPAGDDAAEAFVTNITFNGIEAADNAIRTMSATELRRRLELSRQTGRARRKPLL